MSYQTVFKRYEIKYMITEDQQQRILQAMAPYMIKDRYGESTVRNLYYDTDDYILARHSTAKPDFKEKLRVRSYSQVGDEDTVFVELKRKYDGVVYKRRVAMPESEAWRWTRGRSEHLNCANDIRTITRSAESLKPENVQHSAQSQMRSEIEYFLGYYRHLKPVMFLSYDREAYRMRCESGVSGSAANTAGRADCSNTDPEFRVTFDRNVLCRTFDLSLGSPVYGTPILEPGKVLMELKCTGGIPVWMAKILSEEKIYKTSFSKYGTAYTQLVLPTLTNCRQERKQVRAAAAAEPFPYRRRSQGRLGRSHAIPAAQ